MLSLNLYHVQQQGRFSYRSLYLHRQLHLGRGISEGTTAVTKHYKPATVTLHPHTIHTFNNVLIHVLN